MKGTYSTDDSPSDIAEIRLDKAVPLKVHKQYTTWYINVFGPSNKFPLCDCSVGGEFFLIYIDLFNLWLALI